MYKFLPNATQHIHHVLVQAGSRRNKLIPATVRGYKTLQETFCLRTGDFHILWFPHVALERRAPISREAGFETKVPPYIFHSPTNKF
jgi:hypothetical protein